MVQIVLWLSDTTMIILLQVVLSVKVQGPLKVRHAQDDFRGEWTMKESSNKVELNWREKENGQAKGLVKFQDIWIENQVKLRAWLQNYGWLIYRRDNAYPN